MNKAAVPEICVTRWANYISQITSKRFYNDVCHVFSALENTPAYTLRLPHSATG